MRILGRENELAKLRERYRSDKSELVVLYGRRRVGKSSLIQHFIDVNQLKKNKYGKPLSLTFEGLENQKTPAQIRHFVFRLKAQIKNPLLQKAEFHNWNEVFEFLTTVLPEHKEGQKEKTKKEKIVITLDEFQWMAANQTKLISLLKYYWDNHWKNNNVMLILCGSIASFMVKKVLRSKALYGRFSLQMNIKKLPAREVKSFFPKTKSDSEVIKFLLTFGGVPKYLEEINPKLSFEQNIENLFFKEDALFLEEFDKIFNVHFKEPKNYLAIIKALNKKTLLLEDIAKALKMQSSGGVKAYLENLELAEFVRPTYSYLNNRNRFGKYKVADEFINFYTHFVLPNKRIIQAGGGQNLFRNKILKQLPTWFGFAFENHIINNAIYYAEKFGFADKVESFGSHLNKEVGLQIDLIYLRSDQTLSVCEMKYKQQPISTEVIPEFEAKLKKLSNKSSKKPQYSIHKVLIAPNGVSEALEVSEYFDQIVTSRELFA